MDGRTDGRTTMTTDERRRRTDVGLQREANGFEREANGLGDRPHDT
jgi:hypothetical protein